MMQPISLVVDYKLNNNFKVDHDVKAHHDAKVDHDVREKKFYIRRNLNNEREEKDGKFYCLVLIL